LLPIAENEYGFISERLGAHLARTIMVEELELLFRACTVLSEEHDYRKAIIEENVLLKKTTGTRKETEYRLRQLYGLSPSIFVFKVMRELWDVTNQSHPLLALLCALTRDPILRCTADLIIDTPEGNNFTPKEFEVVIEQMFPGRLSKKTLASTGQNVTSSWAQSGHLKGSRKKTRILVNSEPVVVAYAMLLAYLTGARGDALFESGWLRVLDIPNHIARAFAQQAAQQGWLEYRQSGQITDITFRHFLTEIKL
jgi:hypothetical protein